MQPDSDVPARDARMDGVFPVLLAGGRGTRLHELTTAEAKPALHLFGGHRLIDFALANLWRSGWRRGLVTTQHCPGTLTRHVQRVWQPVFADLVLRDGTQMRGGAGYDGPADALAANAAQIDAAGAQAVLVLAGDHVAAIDYRALVAHHLSSGARLTVAARAVPQEEAQGLGCLDTDGPRLTGLRLPPCDVAGMGPGLPDRPGMALTSTGICVADWRWLRGLLTGARLTDFVDEVIPLAIATREAAIWEWTQPDGTVPYWRDAGTLDAFRQAALDLAPVTRPVPRPVVPGLVPALPPVLPRVTGRFAGHMASEGIELLSPRAGQDDPARWAVLDRCVLMPGARVAPGVRLSQVIVAPGTSIPDGMVIGEDPDDDARWFRVTEGGTRLVTTAMLARRAAMSGLRTPRRPALRTVPPG